MDRPAARRLPPAGGNRPTVESARLARADRRAALLDAASRMVAAGEVDEVSMESVADAAGVSRALVYKHFSNRRELLSALYERESAQLHGELAAGVQAAQGLAGMLRSLIDGALTAQASRGTTFAALGHAGGLTRAQREVQRRRDGQTLRHFAGQAVREYGVDESVARATLGIALTAIPAVLAQWRQRPTRDHAELLKDCYVTMVVGGIERSAAARRHQGAGSTP